MTDAAGAPLTDQDSNALGDGELIEHRRQPLWPIIVGLLVVGVLIAGIGVTIGAFLSNAAPSTLSVERVEARTQVVLPPGTVVLSGSDGKDFSARVRLPKDAVDPLLGSVYSETPDVPSDLAGAGELDDEHFYLALEEPLVYTALSGVNADGSREISFTAGAESPAEVE